MNARQRRKAYRDRMAMLSRYEAAMTAAIERDRRRLIGGPILDPAVHRPEVVKVRVPMASVSGRPRTKEFSVVHRQHFWSDRFS